MNRARLHTPPLLNRIRPPHTLDNVEPQLIGRQGHTGLDAEGLPLVAPDVHYRDLERHECKYLIDGQRLPELRRYLASFCHADHFGEGDPPAYWVTTLQLDTPAFDLARAKLKKSIHRCKLRLRTYGLGLDGPLFAEIKRKLDGVVCKSRALLPVTFDRVHELLEMQHDWPRTDPASEYVLLEFRRMARALRAEPAMFLRYRRESYVSAIDRYARVTLDSSLSYRMARGWRWVQPGDRWRLLDTPMAYRQPRAVWILELKTGSMMPVWMEELIERFRLTRCGFCKYTAAWRMENLFTRAYPDPVSENTAF